MFSALNAKRKLLRMRYRTCSTQPARQSRCQVEINVGQLNYIKLSWSLAAKERQGVQPPLLCDGAEHREPNGLCRSVLGATHARAAL